MLLEPGEDVPMVEPSEIAPKIVVTGRMLRLRLLPWYMRIPFLWRRFLRGRLKKRRCNPTH